MSGLKNAEGKFGNTCEFGCVLCDMTGTEEWANTAGPLHAVTLLCCVLWIGFHPIFTREETDNMTQQEESCSELMWCWANRVL
jgi:hypothetical protein